MIHWLAHLLGLNTGTVETFWLNGEIWVGFRCSRCGEINHASKAKGPPNDPR